MRNLIAAEMVFLLIAGWNLILIILTFQFVLHVSNEDVESDSSLFNRTSPAICSELNSRQSYLRCP